MRDEANSVGEALESITDIHAHVKYIYIYMLFYLFVHSYKIASKVNITIK